VGELWGIGLRAHHYPDLHASAHVPTLEVLADNYLFQRGGPGLWHLDRLAERAPAVLVHGVGLDLGGTLPLSEPYLASLAALCERLDPLVVSDHLCFTRTAAGATYDLLPVPRDDATLARLAARVAHVQARLGRRLTVENVSSYLGYAADARGEAQFLAELAARTGCGLLLDVNNVFVSATNHAFDAREELARYELRAVTQFHVAGHGVADGFLHDTHDAPVRAEVWALLVAALRALGEDAASVPVILERDDEDTALAPVLDELAAGLAATRAALAPVLDERAALAGEPARPRVTPLNIDATSEFK
jgi:uncharacterized protein (UPF0276 family)